MIEFFWHTTLGTTMLIAILALLVVIGLFLALRSWGSEKGPETPPVPCDDEGRPVSPDGSYEPATGYSAPPLRFGRPERMVYTPGEFVEPLRCSTARVCGGALLAEGEEFWAVTTGDGPDAPFLVVCEDCVRHSVAEALLPRMAP